MPSTTKRKSHRERAKNDVNLTTYFYRHKFRSKEAKFNQPLPLVEYLVPLIGDKKVVTIAEIGAGPVNTIGNELPGVEVLIFASDIMWPEYAKSWEQHGKTPLVPIVYQDFENLTYATDAFDIVHCVNAVDHTKDANKAICEMIRVCRPGGYVYLRHAPYQMDKFGGGHYWNIFEHDGRCWFENRKGSWWLHDFAVDVLPNEEIVAIYQKPMLPLRD